MNMTPLDNNLDESLWTDRTSSGLQFILNPKSGFSKTLGIFGVRFGSTDSTFSLEGEKREVPEGTAHFLEHKLFENQDGDVSDRFASHGASCNAGTGFTTTSYLFSCTDKLEENLNLLLDFVQTPYFTPELIAKEQGIIGQEIKMYNDDPDWIVFFNLMKCLYREHPVRQNIAGTLDSIARIDTEALHRCYKAFYRPKNMALVLVGRMDPEAIAEIIHADGAGRDTDFESLLNLPRIEEKDPRPKDRFISHSMVVARPKVLMGFKDLDNLGNGYRLQAKEVVTQMVIDILLGKSSSFYEKLYSEGIIDESFSAYYSGYIDFGFTLMGGDTDEPARFKDRILELLDHAVKESIDEASFLRQKNKYLGKFIRTFNSIESTAFSLLNFHFKGISPTQVMEIIENIQMDDLHERLQRHFDQEQMAFSIIEPVAAGTKTTNAAQP